MRRALSLLAFLTLAPLAPLASAADPAPRRLLFVHAGSYLYLNPLTSAAPGAPDRVRESAEQLAAGLGVPTLKGNDQLFVLSDTLGAEAHPPTKDALAKTLDAFCATTREQDRVVVYFGVYAVEKEGKAYLVPLDGDPEAPATLLPVADVYAKLGALKAAQKMVIWDVCRFNLEKGRRARRDPGPMTDVLFKALTAPPAGVHALVSCSPGERGLEYFAPRGPAGIYAGSAYLDALRQAARDGAKPAPGEPIPVAALHASAREAVAAVAKTFGVKQTPVVAGTPPKSAAAFDPKAAPAKRFDFPAPPKGAPPAEVKAILDELALPAPVGDDDAPLARLAFSEAALKGYAADVSPDDVLRDGRKYPLRVATLRALQAVRDVWPLGAKEAKGVTVIPALLTEKTKRAVADAQPPLALALAKLETELETLEAAGAHRAKETKRWQAHYDYARAEIRLRLALLNEYNLLLARVRTETLPELPAGATGWRLVSVPDLTSRREVKELLAAAHAGYAKLAADHPGTPWEVLARRARGLLPGLRWEVVPGAK